MRAVLQGRQSTRLCRTVHAKMVAHFVKRRDERRMPQSIADPCPRQPVGF